jgi:DNA-binding response OmpR family regulator
MHLLVIEDNPDLVANLYDFFEDRGHTVNAAYDALSGLKFALEGNYDAIILDLMLPGMDGLEVCTRLRESGQQIPILMLTARDTLDNKLDGFASGADDYLVKPFALTELDARLHALIRRASGGQATGGRFRVADLSFDPNTMQVERGGRRIDLPPIPLKLLEILMRKSPHVVTREELERVVWGDSPPDSDALRTHMHVLRTAIDTREDLPLLHTLRGIGYRLVKPDAH